MAGEPQPCAIPRQHACCAGGSRQESAGIAVQRTTTVNIVSAPFLLTFIA
jgi:hypothetical protein